MLKVIKFKVQGIKSENCQYLLETEIDILNGVKNISVDYRTGESKVEFDNREISPALIFKKIEELGYEVDKKSLTSVSSIREHTYHVEGMHCASCEVIIEKRLLKENNIEAVDASTSKGKVVIEHTGDSPTIETLNKILSKESYSFSEKPTEKQSESLLKSSKTGQIIINKQRLKDHLIMVGISLVLIVGFILLYKSGLSALISVNTTSALPMFFIFGILAGLSSCAALVGGIILSMSKQWMEIYVKKQSTIQRLEPHFLFNIGRLISYGLFGALLGSIGKAVQLSISLTSILMFAVSIMMLFLALQMLGVKYFQKFQITAPKFITRYVADETHFNGRYMPFLMGAATFFLPCGFTITAQGLALASGNVIQGGLIMLLFALGTAPTLLAIGFSSIKFSKNKHLANKFLKIAGALVLFFALFNINAQLNVLGLPSLDDISLNSGQSAETTEDGLPPIVDGKQILKTDALAYAYEPNYLKVRSGIPVQWEITDKGTSGCTNAIMSRSLFDGEIALTPGTTSIKEFTPEEPGKYKFSCWMGMVSGVIEVVDRNGNSASGSDIAAEDEIVPSGAQGCGCGSKSSGSCGQ